MHALLHVRGDKCYGAGCKWSVRACSGARFLPMLCHMACMRCCLRCMCIFNRYHVARSERVSKVACCIPPAALSKATGGMYVGMPSRLPSVVYYSTACSILRHPVLLHAKPPNCTSAVLH